MNIQQDILKIGFSAGTRAIDNYDRCCSLFGFKKALRGNFAPQKLLYAKNATKEGYSVWMLAHSNLTENYQQTKARGGKWYNIFLTSNTIKKIWINPNEYVEDNSTRICFAKNKQGVYVFKGVYKPTTATWENVNTGKVEWVRTFERISEIYPISEKPSMPEKESSASNIFDSIKSNEPAETSHVVDNCQIKARILENNKDTTVNIDISLRPFQKALIGKTIGDTFTLPNVKLTYQIKKILIED